MAKVFIGESPDPRVLSGNPLPVLMVPYLAEQVVAISGASVQSNAFSANTRVIRVHTDAICSIAIGANPTATADTTRMAANTTEFFDVRPGHKIAVITNS